ncbi:7685_t:CDS:2 [Dentiscutata erythropus]|uniref:7685_t:CDS:1 n=1 Tax=Dentiscutata erythropus TaxID=1348616 RepID=A0A9N8VZC5_9GLOM|nr:7685_t:CDS:2 [Dentiscutata erythropus]
MDKSDSSSLSDFDLSFITNRSSYNLKSESSNLLASLYNDFINLTTDSIEDISSKVISSDTMNLSNISTNTTSSTIISNKDFSDNEIPEIEIIQYNTGKGGGKKVV